MRYHVSVGDRVFEVVVEAGRLLIDGEPLDVSLTPLGGATVRALRIGDVHRRLVVGVDSRGQRCLQTAGHAADVETVDDRTRRIRQLSGATGSGHRVASVRAPMPGLVVKVVVEEGQTVSRGQGTVIVEAMKMENELSAEADARVTGVLVAAGDTVEKGQVLVELEPAEAGEGAS